MAAMRLDDRAADRQPHADALALGGVERIEDVLEFRRIDPRAGIADGQEHAVRFALRGRYEHVSLSVAERAYGFNGVDDQIQHHLLYLNSIGPDQRDGIREFVPQRSAILRSLHARQTNSLENRIVDVQPHLLGWEVFCQAPTPSVNFAGSLGIPDDPVYGLSGVFEMWLL